MSRDSLGDFEQLLLLAILRRGDDAYGITIRDEIDKRAGRSASLGAIYTALDRLEQKKFVSSWTGGATPERGGRAKRFYRVAAAGQAALRESLAATKRMTAGIEQLLGSTR
jgi:PadR family transcriptional regulator, regulatory protein PadR